MKRIGILIFDDAEELDFIGPLEVFGVASELGRGVPTLHYFRPSLKLQFLRTPIAQ